MIFIGLVLTVIFGQIPRSGVSQKQMALLGSWRADLVFKLSSTRTATTVVYRKKNLSQAEIHKTISTEWAEGDVLEYTGNEDWVPKLTDGQFASLASPHVLAGFDEHSAFIPTKFKGQHGVLLRFDNTGLVVSEAQPEAQRVYGLKPIFRFLGRIGDRVVFWDPVRPNCVNYFEVSKPENCFVIEIADSPEGMKKWHVADIWAAYSGSSQNEIWMELFWQYKDLSPLRLRMVRLDLRKARPIALVATRD